MSDSIINDRTAAYLIRSKLKYSIQGLCEYIKENHSTVDIEERKNKYAVILCNGIDPNAIVTDYLMDVLNESSCGDLPEDVADIVDMNSDLFFSIEEDENDNNEDYYYINLVTE